MKLFKIILNLMINRANKQRWQLEIGSYLLRKGAGCEIGKPIKRIENKKVKTYYIANLHFDFSQNRINYTLTTKRPIVEKKR